MKLRPRNGDAETASKKFPRPEGGTDNDDARFSNSIASIRFKNIDYKKVDNEKFKENLLCPIIGRSQTAID